MQEKPKCRHCDLPSKVRGFCNRHYQIEYKKQRFLPIRQEKQLQTPPYPTTEFTWIALGKDQWAKVDTEDAERVLELNWVANEGYARSTVNLMYMHVFIMNKQFIDHKNQDKLDNRKDNLRFATHSQNSANQKISIRNTSGYKGVYVRHSKSTTLYMAMIGCKRKRLYLGYHKTAEQAAQVYNNKAIELFGEYARLNIIPGDK